VQLLLTLGLALAQEAQVAPPQLVDGASPVHPLGSAGDPLDIAVVVHFDAEGRAIQVDFPPDVPEIFRKPAEEAIRRSTFTPATRDGLRVPFKAELRIHFEPTAAVEEEDVEYEPGEVIVYGQHLHGPPRGAGDIHLDVQELQAVQPTSAASALELAPSVFVSRIGSDSHPIQLFMRGFDARHGQDVSFHVDGVPLNQLGNPHGHGLVDLHFVIPEALRAMRVVEGPYDPAQRDFTVAGSVDLELGLAEPGLMIRASGGSFNTWRGMVGWQDAEQEGTFVAAEAYTTKGYGENRAALRGSVLARAAFEGEVDGFVLGGVSANDYDSPGLIRLEGIEDGNIDRLGTHDPFQGGRAMQAFLAGGVSGARDRWQWQTRWNAAFRNSSTRLNYTGFLTDDRREGEVPHEQRGDMLEQSQQGVTLAMDGRVRKVLDGHPKIRGSISAGLDGRFDTGRGTSMRLRAVDQAPYRTEADFTLQQVGAGLWVDGGIVAFDQLEITAGLRLHGAFYGLTDHCATKDYWSPLDHDGQWEDNCRPASRYGYRDPSQRRNTAGLVPAPRVSIGWEPVAGHEIRAAYGRGFRSLEAQALSAGETDAFGLVDSAELGYIWTHNGRKWRGVHRIVGYFTHVDRDYVFDEEEGTNLAAGETWRGGATVESEVHVGGFTERTSVSYTYAVFGEDAPPAYGYARNDRQPGMLVPYVPQFLGRTDLSYAWQLKGGWSFHHGITLRAVAPRPLPQGERADWIFTGDLATSVRYKPVELGVRIFNFWNAKYNLAEYNYASWFPDTSGAPYPTRVPSRHVSPGAPIQVLVDLTVWFDDLG